MGPAREFEAAEIARPSHILLQFLAWVAARPRTYADAMDAWRTSCPRLAVWEDATGGGLVRLAASPGARRGDAAVLLTPRGAAVLAAAQPGAGAAASPADRFAAAAQ